MLTSHADTTRHDYFELRMIGFAPIGQTIHCVAFVEREADVMRAVRETMQVKSKSARMFHLPSD